MIQVGVHRAAALLANEGDAVRIAGASLFTSDIVDDACELAGFAFLGIGLIVLGAAAGSTGSRRWGRWTTVAGAVFAALAVSYRDRTGRPRGMVSS